MLSIRSVLKVFGMLVRTSQISPCAPRKWVQKIIKKFMESLFQSPFTSRSAVLSRSSSFLSSILKAGCSVILFFLHTPLLCWYLRPSSERTRRRTGQQNFALTSRDYGSINQSEKFPFPKVLTFPRFYPYHKIIDYFYFFLSYKFSIINIQF